MMVATDSDELAQRRTAADGSAALPWPSCRRLLVVAGHLQEDLLEATGRLAEADHRVPRLDHASAAGRPGRRRAPSNENLEARDAVDALHLQDVAGP